MEIEPNFESKLIEDLCEENKVSDVLNAFFIEFIYFIILYYKSLYYIL